MSDYDGFVLTPIFDQLLAETAAAGITIEVRPVFTDPDRTCMLDDDNGIPTYTLQHQASD